MKTYVLDTNVYLTEPEAIYAYEESNIAIPTIVLDEIENFHIFSIKIDGWNSLQKYDDFLK